MRPALLCLAAAAAALTACTNYPSAPPPAAALEPLPTGVALGPRDCFRSRDIRGHTFAGDRTMFIKVRYRDVYRVDLTSACLAGAMRSDPIVSREPPGAEYICKPIDFDISIGRSGFPTPPVPCIVDGITRLSPQEVASLPPRLRP